MPRVSLKAARGQVSYTNATVRSLIRQAYGLKVYPLSGGSDKLSTERFDIVAEVTGHVSKEQTMLMLQSFLPDRFKLIPYRETKELPVYALVIEKSGAKFRAVQDDGSKAEIVSGGGVKLKLTTSQ